MLPNEAITIVGAEQYSLYKGYGLKLKYGGHNKQQCRRHDKDGTPLVAITAMDALDFRGMDNRLSEQMSPTNILRDLEKAAAAFAPVDEEQLRTWPLIATGNWGCGAFGGSAPLKAVLQWIAASEGGRRIRYFPFDVPIGPSFSNLTRTLCAHEATVGDVYQALFKINVKKETDFFKLLASKAESLAKQRSEKRART